MTKRDWLGSDHRGIAILRISSTKQEGNTSHDVQGAESFAYAREHGLELTRVFTLTESAKNHESRKRYSEAIEFALSNGIRHVLFYVNDREARNLTDVERNEKLVRTGKIVLHYVRERKVLHAGSPNSDFLMRDMMAAINKNYSTELGSKVNSGMRAKAERGIYPSSHPPLGYIVDRDRDVSGRPIGKGTVVIPDPDPAARAQVLREFELRAEGYSYEVIRRKVLAEGLVPDHRIPRYWASTIEPRLKNPFYEGNFLWQGVVYRGKHELIIPQELIQKARAVERGISISPSRSDPEGHGILGGGGWLRCACGLVMVYDPKTKTLKSGQKKTHNYYHCTNSRRRHEQVESVTAEVLWAGLAEAVDAIALPESLADAIAEKLNATQAEAAASAQRRVYALTATISKQEHLEDQAYADLRSGILDQDGFQRITLRSRVARRTAQEERARLQSKIQVGARENSGSILELCKRAKSLFLMRSPLERRMFLEMVVSNPVWDGRSVRYDLKKPFSTLAEMRGNLDWWT